MLSSIANNFVKRGHKINIVSLGRKPLPYPLSPRVNLITVPFKTDKKNRIKSVMRAMNNIANNLPYSDIFLANYIFTVIPCIANNNLGRTVFLAQANESYDFKQRSLKILNGLTYSTYKLNIPIVTPSSYLKKMIEVKYNNKALVIPPFVDLKFKKEYKKHKKLRILFVGDVKSKNKGFDILYQVAAKLKNVNFELNIATQRDLKIKADFPVIIHRPKDDKGLANIYGQCDILFHLCQEEGFGLTLLEAMSAGLVCVVSDSGGVRDFIIPNKNCLLVKRDVNSIVKLIKKINENLDYYNTKLSDNAKKTAAQYTESRMIDSFEKLFLKIIKAS